METRSTLTIKEQSDVAKLLNLFNKLSLRTFYGTINAYRKLENKEDTGEEENIEHSSPIWDIDNTPEDWETMIEVARLIVEFLQNNGVEKSAFVK